MRHEVFFDPEAYRLMSEHIRSLYPHEACGVLIGDCRGERIGDVCITENTVADDRAGRSFFIDPLEIYRIEKETAGNLSVPCVVSAGMPEIISSAICKYPKMSIRRYMVPEWMENI